MKFSLAPTKGAGMEGGAEGKHTAKALLKSLQGGELDGTLELRICIAPVNQGR